MGSGKWYERILSTNGQVWTTYLELRTDAVKLCSCKAIKSTSPTGIHGSSGSTEYGKTGTWTRAKGEAFQTCSGTYILLCPWLIELWPCCFSFPFYYLFFFPLSLWRWLTIPHSHTPYIFPLCLPSLWEVSGLRNESTHGFHCFFLGVCILNLVNYSVINGSPLIKRLALKGCWLP